MRRLTVIIYMLLGILAMNANISQCYVPYNLNEPSKEDFLYSSNERIRYLGLNEYNFHARIYRGALPFFDKQDSYNEKYPWLSPYAFCAGNPVMNTDKKGDVVMPIVGGMVGTVIGGGTEIVSQLYKYGEVKNWKSVIGASVSGCITGVIAGTTLGIGSASLYGMAKISGISSVTNVVAGVAEREINGDGSTVENILTDAVIGGVVGCTSSVAGNYMKTGLDKLTRMEKGYLGEAVSSIKYTLKGYNKITPKYDVQTSALTKTGKSARAIYDFRVSKNIFGKQDKIVESKFNTSQLTTNQKMAIFKADVEVVVDRTTSLQLGNYCRNFLMMQSPGYTKMIEQ